MTTFLFACCVFVLGYCLDGIVGGLDVSPLEIASKIAHWERLTAMEVLVVVLFGLLLLITVGFFVAIVW